MSTFAHLVSAVRQLHSAVAGTVTPAVGGSGAPAAGRSTLPAAGAAAVVACCSLLALAAASASADPCPNAQFRTGPGANLPDCRAYEQVTDPNKNGGNAGGLPDLVKASPMGDAITFLSQAGVPGGQGAAGFPTFLAKRGTTSWATEGMMPPAAIGEQRANFLGVTPDLRHIVSQGFELGGGPGTGAALYIRDTGDPTVTAILPYQQKVFSYAFAGASADASKVFFETRSRILTSAAPFSDNLYVWDRASGVVSLAGVLPDGSTPANGSFAGAYDWFNADPTSGGALAHLNITDSHAISSDGGRVYFTSADDAQLFLRRDATSPSASTVKVNASHKTNGSGAGGTDPSGPQPAAFQSATADGSQALFVSSEELTNDATTGTADQGADLYRYDATSGALTDLVADPADPNGADVQGVLGTSADGSYIYFMANGVLASGATAGTCSLNNGPSGLCNVYLYHQGASPQITFVTQLDLTGGASNYQSNDAKDIAPGSRYNGTGFPDTKTSRVSADGQTLLFRSIRPLAGYDNSTNDPGAGARGCVPAGPTTVCPELYRYGADTGQLNCVSCNPAGASPTGAANLTSDEIAAFVTGVGGTQSAVLTRNLSSGGNRIFFETDDPLVSRDTNGTGGCPTEQGNAVAACQDVYEWEADGSGSCQSSSANGGCLYLLSDGQSAQASYFGDASASGNDAFIFTSAQDVPVDQDQLLDIYDARVGGGLASQHPTTSPPCSGDACQGAATPAPAPPLAASVTFTGPGNAKPGSPPARSARPRVLTRTVHGTTFMIKVKVSAKGRIAISGTGIKTARKSVGKAGTYGLRVTLTANAKRTLRRKHKLELKLRAAYAPTGGTTASASIRLTVKPAVRHNAARAGRRATNTNHGARR